MNDKKFFADDFLIRLMAVFFAIILWFYVQGEKPDPVYELTQTFNDVELSWSIGPEYTVHAITTKTVNVTVRGLTEDVEAITKDDISIVLDLENYTEGQSQITINPTLPDGLRVIEVDPPVVEVVIEKWIEKIVPVSVQFTEQIPSNLMLQEIILDPEYVHIEGAVSAVESVDKVIIPYNFIENGPSAEQVELIPQNSYGEQIASVAIKDEVSVELKLIYRKWVPVVINYEGDLPEGIEANPQLVRIAIIGDQEVLENIEQVTTEPIDVSEVANGDEIQTAIIFPEGVKPVSDDYYQVNVVFKE